MSEDEVARLRDAAQGVVKADNEDPMPGGWLMHSRIAALRAALSAVPEGDWRDGYKDGKLPGPRPAPSPEPLDVEWLRIERGWPTPISMRRAAGALDLLTPAKHGDVLRWVADLADASLAASKPVQGPCGDPECQWAAIPHVHGARDSVWAVPQPVQEDAP